MKCAKLCGETTCLQVVVLLEFLNIHFTIFMVYKSVGHETNLVNFLNMLINPSEKGALEVIPIFSLQITVQSDLY